VGEAKLEVVSIVSTILSLVDINVFELTIKFETLCKLWKFRLAHARLLFNNWWWCLGCHFAWLLL